MSFLLEVLIFFCAALVVVPICKRLGLSSVLGYLTAGVLIGPFGFTLIGEDPDELLHFAEIGVVLLLFIIGLEVQPRRLWVMRNTVFGLGTLQVALTTCVLALVLELWFAFGWAASFLVGFAFALSSTAFVLQLLSEEHALNRPYGRAAFGVLLFQDVAVIPAIAIVSIVGASPTSGSALDPLMIAIVVGGFIVARFVLRPVLQFVASTGIPELFAAASLALVLGSALAMSAVGLSMGLGAFMAGMLVADSEYRHQLESDVMPFKGLLLGLFFMAVGIATNLTLLVTSPVLILSLVILLVLAKTLVLFPLALLMKQRKSEALRTAVILSQGGEFAFVLLSVGSGAHLISPLIAEHAVLVVTLSMVTTPFLIRIVGSLLEKQGKRSINHILA